MAELLAASNVGRDADERASQAAETASLLAAEPTWEGWLSALRENRVVAVRHDPVSGFRTWMHGGSREVVDFVRRHERDWRWWDNPEIQRPLVSVVALGPDDSFEEGRPESGIAIRVRCAWENTGQGLPRNPIAELVSLSVDGTAVAPRLITKQRPGGAALADYYHRHHLPRPSPGRHTATAVIRAVGSGVESSRSITFDA